MMNSYNPFFDILAVDTPDGLTPALGLSAIDGVPVKGTGLAGAAYAPGTSIGNIPQLRSLVESNDPDATFVATELAYGASDSDTTIAEFLGVDSDTIDGNGDLEMGPSGLVLTGYVFIPEGAHAITVASDDGFSLSLGGVPFSEFTGARAVDETTRVAEFEGGLYEVELLYFDAGGKMSLNFQIDGLTVDASAFYREADDILSPGAGTPTIPVAEYHPSYTLGAEAIDDPGTETGGAGNDLIAAMGGDDIARGNGGDDEIYGGYGDDQIFGGIGNDVLDGGRGSDILFGGDGDDLLIGRSDAGEQRIGQLATGNPTRDDPDNEVNDELQKLKGYENQPLTADDIMFGGAGSDTFLISPQINAKLEIIEKHTRTDGSINWAGVAGENNELHDHWVDAFGIDVIGDYVAGEDQIAIIGHTVQICNISYRDTDGDGDYESIITVQSNQGGGCASTGASTCNCQSEIAQNGGGGAHDRDLMGYIIVHGDQVVEEDIKIDAGVTYGIVENIADVAEALFPQGEVKETVIDGATVLGYDTRDDKGGLGAITGTPEDYVDNPYADLAEFGDPSEDEEIELTRSDFAPVEIISVAGETRSGSGGNDVIKPKADNDAMGVPAPVAYWNFGAGEDGAYADAKGGPVARAYTLYENQALLRKDGLVEGPDGELSALSFNGEDEFAYIAHDPAFEVSQGTIALWVKPDDLSGTGMFVTKDQNGAGDGGHFRLGHTDDGRIYLRMASGDGGSNYSWKSRKILDEDEWQHIAVSFTEDGVKVYLDGKTVPWSSWTKVEGNIQSPLGYKEAYFINNEEPWVLGADQSQTNLNDTAQQFALDDEDLDNAFDGAIAGFTVYGGAEATDALTPADVRKIAKPDFAPDEIASTAATEAIMSGNDVFSGNAGNDTIYGGGGDDSLFGGSGRDSIEGGYGDDLIEGGQGNDTLDGGRGSDLVMGGAGNDTLIARADAGEDRAGQLVLGEPSRPFPDPQIDDEYLKLVDWIDQPLVADDILVGGAGKDHFQIETLINGTLESIMDNVMSKSRMVHWHGVAGENDRIHDHWVDSIGIDVIADFVAADDKISIIGHTTNIKIDYKMHDSDGDGLPDSVVSIITVYSQQGNGGGAHDEDYLGYVVVHGDLVTEDMVETDAGAHYGIVDTIDELQEALAPTGDVKVRDYNGVELFGYDSRDVEGDPIGSDPEAFAENPYADQVTYGDKKVSDLDPLSILVSNEGGMFDGSGYGAIAHEASLAQKNGAIAFSFIADAPGDGNQGLLSKDHSGNKNGGHFTAWINSNGQLEVRLQNAGNISRYLKFSDEKIVAGKEYHVAFSFDNETLALYVNGELVDAEDGFSGGMLGNTEEILVGASARNRQGDDDNAEWLFKGEISGIAFMNRPLEHMEAILLSESGGDFTVLETETAPTDDGEEEVVEEPGGDTPDPAPEAPLNVMNGDGKANALMGTSEGDMISGRGGNDNIRGRDGDDIGYGGAGNDRIDGGDGDDELVGGGGNDRLLGQRGDDSIYGGGGDDNAVGGSGDDLIEGDSGQDALTGGNGDDSIFGGQGDDRVVGQAGNDLLAGGLGTDVLSGGGGEDRFFFAEYGTRHADRITDFNLSMDTIVLDGEIFTGINPNDVNEAFVAGKTAMTAADRVIYDKTKGEVFYDVDGSGDQSAQLIAKVARNLNLTEDHFDIA
ncbi:hypothetical protein KHP62_13510 [Rhodobacteraceae bacterium NNCM2]|nr:hypothetical protein [Coraliihabitans acroporae]